MGRPAAPKPDIFSLTLLTRIIAIKSGLKQPISDNDKDYLEQLSKIIREPKILGQISYNQLLKVTGRPFNQTHEETEGIDTKTLDKLAGRALKMLATNVPDLENVIYNWKYFQEQIARPPLEVAQLNTFRYYKYLPVEAKNRLDSLIKSRLSELSLDSDSLYYVLYFYSKQTSLTECALLQLEHSSAIVNYVSYDKIASQWQPGVTYKSDGSRGEFLLNRELCFINLAEQGGGTSYKRKSIYLQTPLDNFHSAEMLKGFMVSSPASGAVVVAQEVVMQKHSNFQSAFAIISGDKAIPPEISFELIARRFESNNVNSISELRSSRIYKTLKHEAGFCIVGYIGAEGTERDKYINYALGRLHDNGFIEIKFQHFAQPYLGYIENEDEHGPGFLRINPFNEGVSGLLKMHIYVQVKREQDGDFDGLLGRTLGLRSLHIVGSEMVFIRIKQPTDWDTLQKRIKIRKAALSEIPQEPEEIKVRDILIKLAAAQKERWDNVANSIK